MENNKKIILFDGVCNLCNRWVQFTIKRDKKDVFRFAALQSEAGKRMTAARGIDTAMLDSIILVEPGTAYYTKSDAVLEITGKFGGVWGLFSIFSWIPRPLRDALYDLVARNRYTWYGKKESCMVPSPELRAKFLD